jgi:ribulose-phosphate 3-epimerase
VYEIIDQIDTVLLMTVNPGFGGQQYIPQSTAKIIALRQYIDHHALPTRIQVDGGIGLDTLATVAEAGVDDVVVGSAFFRADGDLSGAYRTLQATLTPR